MQWLCSNVCTVGALRVQEYGKNGSWYLWIRAWSWGPSQKDGRAHEVLRKLRFWCLACDIALELVWVPAWANPADAPSRSKPIESWYASLPKLPSTPAAVLASAPALSELIRGPPPVADHTAGEHVRELESSGAFGCLKTKRVCVKSAPSQPTYAESTSTPTDIPKLPRKGVKNEWKDEKAEGAADSSFTSHWPRHDPIFIAPSWF